MMAAMYDDLIHSFFCHGEPLFRLRRSRARPALRNRASQGNLVPAMGPPTRSSYTHTKGQGDRARAGRAAVLGAALGAALALLSRPGAQSPAPPSQER